MLNNAGVMDGVFSGDPIDYRKQKPLIFAPIHEATDEYWDRVFLSNAAGVFRSMRAELKQMVAQGRVARRNLLQIHAATELASLRIPPDNQLEALRADRKGQHSIRIDDQ